MGELAAREDASTCRPLRDFWGVLTLLTAAAAGSCISFLWDLLGLGPPALRIAAEREILE